MSDIYMSGDKHNYMTLAERSLFSAILHGDIEKVKELLTSSKHEINLEVKDHRHWNPLYSAIFWPWHSSVEICKLLLEAGASLPDNEEFLFQAFKQRNKDKVKLLLDHGAVIHKEVEYYVKQLFTEDDIECNPNHPVNIENRFITFLNEIKGFDTKVSEVFIDFWNKLGAKDTKDKLKLFVQSLLEQVGVRGCTACSDYRCYKPIEWEELFYRLSVSNREEKILHISDLILNKDRKIRNVIKFLKALFDESYIRAPEPFDLAKKEYGVIPNYFCFCAKREERSSVIPKFKKKGKQVIIEFLREEKSLPVIKLKKQERQVIEEFLLEFIDENSESRKRYKELKDQWEK